LNLSVYLALSRLLWLKLFWRRILNQGYVLFCILFLLNILFWFLFILAFIWVLSLNLYIIIIFSCLNLRCLYLNLRRVLNFLWKTFNLRSFFFLCFHLVNILIKNIMNIEYMLYLDYLIYTIIIDCWMPIAKKNKVVSLTRVKAKPK